MDESQDAPRTTLLTKSEAIALFGTRHADLAQALGVTDSRISQLPDVLDQATSDRVIGAAIRLGKLPAQQGAQQ